MTSIRPTPRPNITKMTQELLDKKEINRNSNDYAAHLRGFGGKPGPLAGQQFRLDVREARKLAAAVMELPKDFRSGVVQELLKRATPANGDRLGSMRLSEAAAKELTNLASKVGVEGTFAHGQPRPIHPVG